MGRNKVSSILTAIFIAIVLFFVGFLSGKGVVDGSVSNTDEVKKQELVGKNTASQIFSTQKIQEAGKIIQKEYYHFSEKSKTEIEDGMIQSMVSSLGDKHSNYFDPKEAVEFSESLSGDFEGIGAVIDEDMKGILIRKVIQDSPAMKAGLHDQDIITHVGVDSLVGVSTEDAVKKIRGPKGSTVMITYISAEDSETHTIQVVRDKVIVPSVGEKMLTGSIGYVEMSFFGEHTTDEFKKSIENLTNSGAQGVILDMRNNGGGYLDTAVNVLGFLLPKNSPVVITRENKSNNPKKFSTWGKDGTVVPIVMLVNELSASATEITAGALQDYGRAIILGQKTYGKGSVQEQFILSDGSILKLTVGRWYTPNDREIDKKGIEPDISVPVLPQDFQNRYDRQFEAGIHVIQKLIEEGGDIEVTKKSFDSKSFTQ